jgi:hypothetical protein
MCLLIFEVDKKTPGALKAGLESRVFSFKPHARLAEHEREGADMAREFGEREFYLGNLRGRLYDLELRGCTVYLKGR